MSVYRKVGLAVDQIALSAGKGFIAASTGYAAAHAAGYVGNTDQLKGMAFAALVAGVNAALKVAHVALAKDLAVAEIAVQAMAVPHAHVVAPPGPPVVPLPTAGATSTGIIYAPAPPVVGVLP